MSSVMQRQENGMTCLGIPVDHKALEELKDLVLVEALVTFLEIFLRTFLEEAEVGAIGPNKAMIFNII